MMFICFIEKNLCLNVYEAIVIPIYLGYIPEYNTKLDNKRENTIVVIVWIIRPLGINEQLLINHTKNQ